MKYHLPEGCTIQRYDDDLLLIGPDLDKARYSEIRRTLPVEIVSRLIGWRRIGKCCQMTTLR